MPRPFSKSTVKKKSLLYILCVYVLLDCFVCDGEVGEWPVLRAIGVGENVAEEVRKKEKRRYGGEGVNDEDTRAKNERAQWGGRGGAVEVEGEFKSVYACAWG